MLHSQSFPHFWSIFYALLHYSQLPFTVHYLLPSFTNTLYTSLSFSQSLCFPHSFSPSLSSSALWHFPFPSPLHPLYNLFVSSLGTSSHTKHLFYPYLYFPSSLLFSMPYCLSALLSSSLLNWLLEACYVIWYLMLSLLFYNTNIQMSANIINNNSGQSFNLFVPLRTHEWTDKQQTLRFDDVINHYITSCNT